MLFEFLKQLFNHQCPFVHSSVSPSESKTHKHLKFNYSATLSTTIIITFTTNFIYISTGVVKVQGNWYGGGGPIFVKNMEIFENSLRDFGADLLFSVRAMGQIYFQFVE